MSGLDVRTIVQLGGPRSLDDAITAFRTFADEAPFGLYLTDPTGNCIWANRRWLETAGLTMDQAVGRGWLEGLHPDERDSIGERWYRAAASDGAWGFDYRFLDDAGTTTWVHGTAGPMRGPDGEIVGYVGLNVDVGDDEALLAAEEDRARAEDALRASEDRYHAVVSALHEGVILQERSGRILAFNPEAERVFGITAEEAMGHTSTSRDWGTCREDGSVLPGTEHPTQVTFKTGQPCRDFVLGITRHDGGFSWISANTTPLFSSDDDEPYAVVVSFADITEHKRMENDLRASEELFRTLFERSNIGKSITRPTGEIRVNRAFSEMLGLTPEELEHCTWREITHPDDIELTQRQVDRLLSGEADSTRFEKRFLKQDGSVVWVDLSSSVQRHEDGTPDYLMSAVIDVTEAHRVEEELRASEEMRDVAESVADVGSWHWDFATQKATWSPGMVRLFQGDVADYGGDASPILTKRIHPDDAQTVADATALALERSEATPGLEFRIVLDDGTIGVLHGEGATEYDDDGRAVGITGYYQDVTEQRETEEELRSSQERYQALLASLSEGVVLQLRDGTVVSMNEAAGRILNVPTEEALGATSTSRDWGAISPDGSAFPGEEHPAMVTLRTGEPCTDVIMGLKRPDESVCWLSINANPLFRGDEPEPYAASVSFTDISERKRAEEELRRTAAMLQAAMDQSPAGIAIADAPEGTLHYVNDAALLIRGGDRATIVNGVGIHEYVASWELFDLDGRPLREDEPPLARAILFGETGSREFVVRRTDGVDRIVIGNAAPIKDDHGTIVAGIVVFSDVTDLKDAEQKLRELAKSLEVRVEERTEALSQAVADLTKANEAKTRFLRSMSHELRTPLNSVIGFSSLMLDGLTGPLSEEQSRQLGMINSSGRHLLSLINDILDLSRIEAGRVDVYPEPVDVTELLHAAVATVSPAAVAKGLDLRLDLCEPPPALVSDEMKVNQILLNLLDNAIKYTATGSVTLSAARGAHDTVVFSVGDTGPGISPDNREEIFGEFTRVDDEGRAPEQTGTGLGLAISRGLAGSLGGALELDSEVGRGSTFALILPASAEGAPPT